MQPCEEPARILRSGHSWFFFFSWLGSWARTANSQRKGSFNCNQLSALPKGIPRWNKVYSQVEMVWHGNIMKNRHDKNASDLKKASWGGVVAPRGTIRTILLHVVLQTRGEHHQSATTSLINLTCQAVRLRALCRSLCHANKCQVHKYTPTWHEPRPAYEGHVSCTDLLRVEHCGLEPKDGWYTRLFQLVGEWMIVWKIVGWFSHQSTQWQSHLHNHDAVELKGK